VIPLAFFIAAAGWLVLQFLLGRSPGTAVRRTDHPELLGPGGPDDPDRGR